MAMRTRKAGHVFASVGAALLCLVLVVGCAPAPAPTAAAPAAPPTALVVPPTPAGAAGVIPTIVAPTEAPAPAAAAVEPETFTDILPVNVGVGPYPMYQQFQMAAEDGTDKVFGLKLTVSQVTSTSVGYENLLRGSIDVSTGAIADHVPVFETSPDVVSYMPIGIFVGFFYVGRAKDTTAWPDLVSKMGLEAAKKFQIEQMKGRTFAIIPQRKPWIISTISQFGMTENDVKFVFFADDQKAATAFLAGTGDYYMGSLPQQTAILDKGADYVNAGGQDIMGDAGLWYDTTLTTNKFIVDNPEAAARLYALICAMTNQFNTNPVGFSTHAVKVFQSIGTTFTVEQYIQFETVYDHLLTFEEAGATYFNPDSWMYWKKGVDYQVAQFVADGTLKQTHDSEQWYGQGQKLYESVAARPGLVALINTFKYFK
jgi:ABC-type nitrate/sulfonate/bicarbonate transport system substrate-binding protein